jgi:hypothetical protein
MATTLATLRQLLSSEIGDVIFGTCASTTTADGNAGGTTLIDTALCALPSDWIRTGTGSEPQTHILFTSGTHAGQIRPCTTFANGTGTITFSPAVTAASKVAQTTTYEIHRFAHPTMKEDCIAKAVRDAFPDVYVEVDSEVYHYGNWLIDGHFEAWTAATTPTYWTATTTTATQTAMEAFGGAYCCALSTANGYISQSSTNNKDLLMLGGTTPTLYGRVKCTAANQLRLAVYDGTTFTYSSYHTGGGGWELLTVSATLADNPSAVSIRAYLTGFASTAYLDNMGLVGVGPKYNYDISNLGLVNGVPNLIYTIAGQELNSATYYPLNDSYLCTDWRPLGQNKIQFTKSLADGTKLRIVGRKYPTEPTSSVSTEPEAPQTYVISALAAKRLFASLGQTAASHSVDVYRNLEAYWEEESSKRRMRYGMKRLPITRLHG